MTEAAIPADSSGSRAPRGIIGVLLVLPAAAACLLTFFLPSLNLVLMSFQDVRLFGGESKAVGLANYASLGELFGRSSVNGMTLTILVIRLLAVLIVPPLLALGVSRGGSRPLQIVARLFSTVPAALFAPFVTLLAWFLVIRPEADPRGIRGAILLGDGILTLTLACAVTLPVYLAALKKPGAQPPDEKISYGPFVIVWVVSLLAVVALSAQAFAIGYITQGGPARTTETLMLLLYRLGFVNFRLGLAAALGTMLLGFVLLIGLIAGVVVVLSKVALQTVSPSEEGQGSSGAQGGPIAIGVVMVVLSLACCALAALPYAAPLAQAPLLETGSAAQMLGPGDIAASLLYTIIPQVIGVFLLQLPLTYLAAIGIGAVRPFGKFSEFLLLPFSPWLFATVGPLLIVFFLGVQGMGGLDTMMGLMPRFAISIPILFILTLFFKGQEAKRQAAKAEDGDSPQASILRGLILPSLPLAFLLGFVAVLVGMQSIEWPLVAVNSPERFTLPVLLATLVGQFGMRQSDLGMVLASAEAPIFLAFLLIFASFQVFYLPRLSLARREAAVIPAESAVEEAGAGSTPSDQE